MLHSLSKSLYNPVFAANAAQAAGQKNPAVTVQSTGYGAIAQLGERLHGMQEVSGSIPLSSTRIWEASEKRLPKREKDCYDGGLSSARQKTR
ncbi:exported hypothetical protein [Cupriavidus taiwanensis]|nr:exported hypothetical protein [Cupriavidus taiwanensis]